GPEAHHEVFRRIRPRTTVADTTSVLLRSLLVELTRHVRGVGKNYGKHAEQADYAGEQAVPYSNRRSIHSNFSEMEVNTLHSGLRDPLLYLSAVAVMFLATAGPTTFGQSSSKVDFARDVQPLFKEHCVGCHGPSQQMQGLRLDRRRDAMNIGGRRGILPGDSAESPLYLRVAGNQL